MYLTKEKIYEYSEAVENSEITLIVATVSEKKLETKSDRFASVLNEMKRLFGLGVLQVLIYHLKIKVCSLRTKFSFDFSRK